MLNRLTDSLDFQANALSLRAERQRLLASNIANADTPGYVARDMDFASALREASGPDAWDSPRGGSVSAGLGLSGVSGAMGLRQVSTLAATQSGHIQLAQPMGGARSAAGLRYALAAQTNLDSNTVDMDRERASFAENSVKYEATLRFINGSVRSMLDAMKSPSQG
jgi:flagellar basal-body rod protein FlgB